jgi:hypothetical protein
MTISLRQSAIINSIELALSLLRKTYRSNPYQNEFGWYHYLDDPSPGVTASAVSLFCFSIANQPFEHTEQVITYLKDRQIFSSDPRLNGGWSVRTTFDFPVVESTAWVLRSLYLNQISLNKNSPDIKAAYSFLVNNQNMDHGWGSCYGQPSRIFHTSLAIIALASFNRFSQEVSLGADWLIQSRQKDIPAWGALPDSSPSALHTSWALLALSELPYKIPNEIIEKSLIWLIDTLDPTKITELTSQAEDYDVPFMSGGKSFVYQFNLPHFCLPVAVYTLLKLSRNLDSTKMCKAINTIIESQTDTGFWPIPRSPSRPSIWGIWPFLAALIQASNLYHLARDESEIFFISENVAIIQPEKPMAAVRETLINPYYFAIKRFINVYFGWLFLALFATGGFLLAFLGLISWIEFSFSLLVPIILLVVQIIIEKTKRT